MNAVNKWHDVMKSGGSGAEDKLDELLHEDVIFYSPVVFTPQRGKEITKLYCLLLQAYLVLKKQIKTQIKRTLSLSM